MLDFPFRSWLEQIKPADDEIDGTMEIWRKTAIEIALALGQEMVVNSGPKALVGRFVKTNERQERLYNSPLAYAYFSFQIRKLERRAM